MRCMGGHMRKYFIGLIAGMISLNIYANPVLDNVGAGNVTVEQTSNSTVVNQTSQQAIINWQSFNIGQGESTHFQQPTGGIALNRINPTQGASSIYGSLTATGQIVLVNPAGIYFAPGAFVSVGGLIATTSNITDQDFLNNNFRFTRDPNYSGSIVNEGQIIAAAHGLVALAGSSVTNKGLIQAELGNVVLASGSAFTINFAGDRLINFTIDEKATGSSPGVTNTNTGVISANGGQVLVTAKAAQSVLDQVINMNGVIEARSVAQKNGEIIFSGDADNGVVRVAAKVDASGKNANEKGGNVKITGYNIAIDDGANIDVSGDAGGGNINIGGNYQGKGPLPNANAVWMSNLSKLNADAITNGNGGNIIVWSDNHTIAQGDFSARGGALSGDGGFIETSGKYLNANNVRVNTLAANGKRGMWLLDPTDLTISNAADANVSAGPTFTGDNNSNTSNLNVTTLTTALAGSDVTVQTTAGGTGTGTGDITVVDPVTWASTNRLTLLALDSIFINADITATNGGLTLQAAGSSQANANVTVGTSLIFANTGAFTFNGIISGAGGIDKQIVATTLTLNGANNYTGSTTITGGTIQLGIANALPTSTTLLGTGTLELNGFSQTLANMTGGNTITNSSGTAATLTLNNAGSNTFSGVMSGNLSFVKNGAGTLAISSASTYSGSTAINNGTLQLQGSDLLPSTTAVTLAGGTVLDLNNNDLTIGSLSGSGNVTTGGGNLTTGGNNSSTTYSGIISDGGDLIKEGTGTFTLTGNNNYTGSTVINAGTLRMGIANALPSTTAVGIANVAGATLDLNNFDQTIAILALGGTTGGNVTLGSATLTLNSAASFSYGGVISGTGGIIKQGAGTQTFTNAQTYTGSTVINGGTLQLGTNNVFSNTSAVTIANAAGATLDLNGFNDTINVISGGGGVGGTISLGAGTLTTGDSTSNTFAGVISGTGNIVKQGTGTWTLSGNNTYSGLTTINAGTLNAASATALG
jgi:filamentous hemagglutinin family protein